MVKYLFFDFLILVLVHVLTGCKNLSPRMPDALNEIQPAWECKLPGDAGIYNDGLIGLPVFKNEIFFHSTYFTGKQGEDNRIHAIDLETGKINWTYPAKYNKENKFFFWGVPYLYGNQMVLKMPASDNTDSNDKIICLNLDAHQENWSIKIPDSMSVTSGNNIVGAEGKFYFTQESASESFVFEGDIIHGDTNILFQFQNKNSNQGVEISTDLQLIESGNDKFLVFGLLEWTSDKTDLEFDNFIVVLHPDSRQILHKIFIPKTEKFSINQIYTDNDKIWLTCGRNTCCIRVTTGEILWNYYSPESLNYLTTGICLSEDVLFLWGDNRFQALKAETGEKLYQRYIECGNASVFDGVVYIIGRDARLYCVDIRNGDVLNSINCPESRKNFATGFLTGCKPHVYRDCLYLFGNFHAYAYLLSDLLP